MRRLSLLLLLFSCAVVSARPLEKSKLFVKHVDSESGVISYVLKPGLVKDNTQSLYFTQKAMTNDGRFILFDASDNEFKNKDPHKRLHVVDLKKDKIFCLVERCFVMPYLDVDKDVIYYCEQSKPVAIYKIDLKDPNFTEQRICRVPEHLRSLGNLKRLSTHTKLTADNRYMFCDAQVDDRFIQGRLDLTDGSYEYWGETPFNLNHGQINPFDKDLALAAHEIGWRDSKGEYHKLIWEPGKHPRLQLLAKDKRDTIKCGGGKNAYHEAWDSKGEGFFYCASGGVYYYSLKTKETSKIAPWGNHADLTEDMKYVVKDIPKGDGKGYFRGLPWMIDFYNRETGKSVNIHSYCPAIATREKPSRLHPDPHPNFNCHDKYIICTMNGEDGNMHLSVTPVEQLIKMTSSKD